MCGRFALDFPATVLSNWYNAASIPELLPSYNVAQMSNILVIREAANKREGSLMRWGFVPHWTDTSKKPPLLINAKAETVASKPIFKNVFRKQRCIIPASGFYEWQLLADKKNKQPYYISANDGRPVSLAGIWERATIDDEIIQSCAILTTECNELVSPIHDRMPVIISHEFLDAWLRPADLTQDILEFLIQPYDSGKMQSWPVSPAVNNARNQGEQLIQPIHLIP
ncbi:MAG: SOS response-associated peptidase [Nitrosomonas sp.]|nr:SOS response-associated peptidase [Nitrosomonas sp.]